MISIILIFLAAICNAVMDVCSFHYYNSVFKNKNPKYWNPEISWKNKYVDWDKGNKKRKKIIFNINFPVQLTDAWHFFKSSMLLFLISAVVLYKPIHPELNELWSVLILGTVWNVTFSLFYNKLLR